MAVIKQAQKTATVQRPVARPVAQTVSRPVARPVAKPKEVAGFTVLKGVEIPPKKAFGGKRGVYNDLFSQLEQGDCVEVAVEEGKKNIAKMNGLYNAARRVGADITIRIHDNGADGTGGVLRMWYNGQKQTA